MLFKIRKIGKDSIFFVANKKISENTSDRIVIMHLINAEKFNISDLKISDFKERRNKNTPFCAQIQK